MAADLTPAEVVTRFPSLWPLVALDDPPWRFQLSPTGVLDGQRTTPRHVEALCVHDGDLASAIRVPLNARADPAIAEVDFTGRLEMAVRLLRAGDFAEG